MDTSGENSPVDKKKKVQYVNNFHTGKTKVIEKKVNLGNSLNSYFDNNTCSSLVSTSSKEDDDKGRNNESLEEASRPILNDSQFPERYTDEENLVHVSHENILINRPEVQGVDLNPTYSKGENLGTILHSTEHTDGYCDILWKDTNEIKSSTHQGKTITGQSVIDLSKHTGQEHEIIKTYNPISNQVSGQNTEEIFDIVETEDILVNMNEGEEHRIYSTDNSEMGSKAMEVLTPFDEISKFNSENSKSTNNTTDLQLCNKTIDEHEICYLTTEQTSNGMMQFPSKDSVFPRPKDPVEQSIGVRYRKNEVVPKQLEISDEVETEEKLRNANVSYERPEKNTNSLRSEDESTSISSLKSDSSNEQKTNDGFGGEISHGLVVTKNEINDEIKQNQKDKKEIYGQPENRKLDDTMNSKKSNLRIQKQSLESQKTGRTKDCGTQTDFAYSSVNEIYNILCEKCGNIIDMKEVLLHILKYPLVLKSSHKCTESDESGLVDKNNDRAVTNKENMSTLQMAKTSMDNNKTSNQGNGFLNKNPQQYNVMSLNLSGMPCQEVNIKTCQPTMRPPIKHSENQDLILKNSISSKITNIKTSKEIAEENKIQEKASSDEREPSSLYAGLKVQRAREEFEQAVEGFQDVYTSFPPAIKEGEGYNQDQDLSSSNELYSAGMEVAKSVIEVVAEANKPFDDMEDAKEEYQCNDTHNKSKMLPPRQEEHQHNNGNHVLKGSCQTVLQTKSYNNPLYIQNHTNKKGLSYNKISYPKMKHGYKTKYKHRCKADMMDKLSIFSDENSLDVHNVSADGNCMFSAVVDQLWINGNFIFTPDSLRKEAVEFLRKCPTHRDGTHLDSFLDTESWDEYLRRMERKGEWGDHMVLQGVSEVTHCRILVINSDLVKTELNPWHSTHDETQIDIVSLGHMGEYHYVSLRPSNWKETWAIRAKMKLMHELQNPHNPKQDHVFDDDQQSVLHTREEGTDLADKEIIHIDQDQTEDNHDRTELTVDDENLEQGNKDTGVCDAQQTDKMSACNNESNAANGELDLSYIAFQNTELLQKSHNFKATEILFDTQEDLNRLVMEANFIDPLSGVPTQHLSFYLRQLLEPSEIYVDNKLNTLNYNVKTSARDQNVDVLVYGSAGERMVVSLNWCCQHTTIQPQILFYQSDVANIVYEAESAIGPHSLLVDTNSCAPGNLTLQIPYPEYFESSTTEKIKETVYLRALNSELTVTFCNQHIHPKITQGIECSQWPKSLTSEWHTRERPSGFPDSEMLKELASRACYVRKYSNNSNQNSDIEWQFVFPTVETDLLRDMMNPNMKYALRLFKMITNFQTETVQRGLRTNHLKTVMLYSCESVPISVWSNNIGGGVLFLISSLMLYLYRRCLPHYIMASVNLLEEYSDLELDNLLMCLEQIRLFPLMAFNVFAENNHLRNQWIIDPIVNDLHRFRNDRDHLKSIEQAFCPTLIELAKRLVMFGVHYFEKGFTMIERAYDSIYDLEKQRKVENPQTFEQFIEPFAYAVEDPITRYFFTDFVDSKLRTNILSKMVDSDHVRIVGDVGGREAGGKYNEFPIPAGSKLDDVEYLQSLANYLMTIDKTESAAHFFRCGIALGRCAFEEEIIDVSEIIDEEVKKQIVEKNMKTTQNFHYTLYSLYTNLIDCYNHMKQTILFQEFIHDFEELVETLSIPCYFRKLAETWDALGNEEKADLYHGKADQHQHNKHSTRV